MGFADTRREYIVMTNDLVTIGFIAEQESKNTVYAINSILGQNYSNIELIISVDKTTGISIREIIECLNSNRRDNVKNVEVNCTRDYWGIDRHVEYIFEKAAGTYLTFVKNTEGYYDSNAIEALVSEMENVKQAKAGKGQTIIFDEEGNYQGNAVIHSKEDKSVLYTKEGFIIQSVLYKPLEECYSQEEVVMTQIPFLRFVHQKEEQFCVEDFAEKLCMGDEKALNYTKCLKLQQMLGQWGTKHNCDIQSEIYAELRYLQWKDAHGFWKLTDADLSYGKMLFELLRISQKNSWDRKIAKGRIGRKVRKQRKGKKLRLVFFAQEYSVWPSMQSIYEAAAQDGRYETDLVYVPFEHFNAVPNIWDYEYEHYRNAGYHVIKWSEYDLNARSPDIAFFLKPYDGVPKGFYIDEIITVIDRCISISYGIMLGVHDKEFIRLNYCLPLHVLAWKILGEGPEIQENFRRYSYTHGNNCWKIGNPRLDSIGINPGDTAFMKDVKKLAGNRKIVLWNSHHTITEDGALGTFLLYSKHLIEYAREHKELFFVWRPHPLFFGALQKCMLSSEYDEFWDDVEHFENLVVDRQKDYREAFYLSDAMVSDFSSLVKEYALCKKPLLIMHKTQETVDSKLLESVEHAYCFGQVENFLGQVAEGKIESHITDEDISKEYYLPAKHKTVAEWILDEIIVELLSDAG